MTFVRGFVIYPMFHRSRIYKPILIYIRSSPRAKNRKSANALYAITRLLILSLLWTMNGRVHQFLKIRACIVVDLCHVQVARSISKETCQNQTGKGSTPRARHTIFAHLRGKDIKPPRCSHLPIVYSFVNIFASTSQSIIISTI